MKEALFWEKKTNKKVKCRLCPHECVINEGKRGLCGVRENQTGKLYTLVYGRASSICPDPIEKKPLYHFHPAEIVLSLSTVSCNFKCKHCQNYTISQMLPENYPLETITPEDVVSLAERYKCKGISWTYNEPTIWYEFMLDASKIAKSHNLHVTCITNGFINPEPLKTFAPYLDAANIDVKSFSDKFYREICRGKLQPVLETVKLAYSLGIHIELTYLVIPEHNDSIEEIETVCKWISENVDDKIPVHFSRFYPHYKMTTIPPTPMKTMLAVYKIAKKYLYHVYLGNVSSGEYDNTYCIKCDNLLIERFGFSSRLTGLKNGRCSKCNEPLVGVFK